MDGLAATLAAIACVYFAIDAATVHENDLVLVLSLSLAFACAGFLPFNLRPTGGARVFMGDAGSQLLGFLLAALGARIELDDDRNDGRDDPAAAARARDPDPRHDARHRPAARRAPPGHPGRKDHSSHRLVYYGLSETRRGAPRADRRRARRDLGRLQRARPAGDHRDRGAPHLRAARPVRELPHRALRARATRPTGRHALRRAIAVQPRRLLELLADAVLVRASFLAAYLMLVDGRGTELQRGTFLAALPVVLGTTLRRLRPRGHLPPRLALRHRPRPRAIALAVRARDARRVRDRRRHPRPRRLPARRLSRLRRRSPPCSRPRRAGWSASCPCAARRGRQPATGARRRRGQGGPRPRARPARRDEAAVVGFLDDNPRLRAAASRVCRCSGRPTSCRRARAAGPTSSSSRSPMRPRSSCSTQVLQRLRVPWRLVRERRSGRRPRRRGRSRSERDHGRAGRSRGDTGAARRGLAPAARRVPPARDALRLAGVAPRDADDLHRRARVHAVSRARSQRRASRPVAARRTASRASSRG